MLRHKAASAIALLLLSSIATAQQPNPVRVRGTIESKDHQTLDVKTRGGETLKVKLADNAPVIDDRRLLLTQPNEGTVPCLGSCLMTLMHQLAARAKLPELVR
jgi:hypothetical protein